jgi:hypothetical protein
MLFLHIGPFDVYDSNGYRVPTVKERKHAPTDIVRMQGSSMMSHLVMVQCKISLIHETQIQLHSSCLFQSCVKLSAFALSKKHFGVFSVVKANQLER